METHSMTHEGNDALAQLRHILATTDKRLQVRIYVRELAAPKICDWPEEARKFAQHLRRQIPGIENNDLAPLVQKHLHAAGVRARGGRLPSLASILRRGL